MPTVMIPAPVTLTPAPQQLNYTIVLVHLPRKDRRWTNQRRNELSQTFPSASQTFLHDSHRRSTTFYHTTTAREALETAVPGAPLQ